MHSSPLEKLVRKTTCTSVDSILCEEKKNWRRRKIRSNSKETVLFFRLFSSIPPPFFSPSLPPRFFSFHTSNRDKGKIKEEEEKSEERGEKELDGEIFEQRFKAVKRRRAKNRTVKQNPWKWSPIDRQERNVPRRCYVRPVKIGGEEMGRGRERRYFDIHFGWNLTSEEVEVNRIQLVVLERVEQ